MARPAKSSSVSTGKISKEERDTRLMMEAMYKGATDKLRAPDGLTPSQKAIFENIVNELPPILGNIDIYILTRAATTLDYLETIEQEIQEDPSLLHDSPTMQNRDRLNKDFYRCCNELSLSPQARAKLSIQNVAAAKEKRDPLLDILNG